MRPPKLFAHLDNHEGGKVIAVSRRKNVSGKSGWSAEVVCVILVTGRYFYGLDLSIGNYGLTT